MELRHYRVELLALPLPRLVSAITMIRKTATPTAQTHQWPYQTSLVVVVVTLPLVVVLAFGSVVL